MKKQYKSFIAVFYKEGEFPEGQQADLTGVNPIDYASHYQIIELPFDRSYNFLYDNAIILNTNIRGNGAIGWMMYDVSLNDLILVKAYPKKKRHYFGPIKMYDVHPHHQFMFNATGPILFVDNTRYKRE